MSRGYSMVGLVNPKNGINVGSAIRAAHCYGVSAVAVSGNRPSLYMKRMATDTQKGVRYIPVFRGEDLRSFVPYDCVPVAVDLIPGARCLTRYTHPERAFYIFGPEDGTLGASTTDWCRDVVSIPTRYCMNLAATVNVVLYDRMSKCSNTSTALIAERKSREGV